MTHDPLDDVDHCGRPGCRCLHIACDRGWRYTTPRVETHDGPAGTVVIEHEQVTACPECKPETVDAAARAASRAEFLREARRVDSFR